MPETISTTVYTFDELDAAGKEKARDWYREASMGDTFFAEHIIEEAVNFGAMMGIEVATHGVKLMNGQTRQEPTIWWELGYSQGDYACFEGRYKYASDAAKALSAEIGGKDEVTLTAFAARLEAVQKSYNNALTATVSYHHYYGMQVEMEALDADGEPLDLSNEDADEIKEIFRDFNRWIYFALRDENDYQNADEQVDDTIRANEYTFTEDGERFG